MKKALFILLLFIAIFFALGNKVEAASCYFKWVKTKIDVPYLADINEYTDLYVVKFYLNGHESNDYCVMKEVNGTTFSTVLTYRIGLYKVVYCAYNEEYNVYSYQDIVFNVYDDEAPTIKGPDFINLAYGQSLDILQHYQVVDNVDALSNLNIFLIDRDVSYDILGRYPATIVAIDKASNETRKEIEIEIYDNIRPTIKVLKDLYFSYGKTIAIDDYFLITDNYDDNPRINIEFDENAFGRTSIIVTASDSSGNSITQRFVCYVIDDINPIIRLSKTSDRVDIDTIEDFYQLLNSYIMIVDDNYDKKEDLKIIINSPITNLEVGSFTIEYKVIDREGNMAIETLNLEMVETIGPIITSEDNYEFDIGQEVDLMSLIEVSDLYDSNVAKNVEVISSNVDFKKAGNYRVIYRAYNSSGNYTLHEVNVNIKESAPTGAVDKKDNRIGFYITFAVEAIIIIALLAATIKKKKQL